MSKEEKPNDFKKHCCRVCGVYYEDYYPWGEDGKTATFDICQCCNVEFGYEDFTEESTESFRKQWIANGPKWRDHNSRPENWNVAKQLENILPPEKVQQLLEMGNGV